MDYEPLNDSWTLLSNKSVRRLLRSRFIETIVDNF